MAYRSTPTEPSHKFPKDSCPLINEIQGVLRDIESGNTLDQYHISASINQLEEIRKINSSLRDLAGEWKEWAEHQQERADDLDGTVDDLRRDLEEVEEERDKLKAQVDDLEYKNEKLENTINSLSP